jgi:tetratricopeptide (TPR) repeat protein
MLGLVGCILLAAASAQSADAPGQDPCAGDPHCRHATAEELFADADSMVAEGDFASAETLLQALTGDPNADFRAEARFRLAAVRERQGDLAGAVAALRALLAEKPDAQRARLELSRLLALQGNDRAARQELRQAQAKGLPSDVAITVRRFSTALDSFKKRGAYFEAALAYDSNVNRSTSALFVDTVIAPFELDPDARKQDGAVLGLGLEAYSRDSVLDMILLTRAGLRGDLALGKKRFNDIQLSLSSGPEIQTGFGKLRPAVVHERRWYGGRDYSVGYGGSLNWSTAVSPRSQIQIDASAVRQSIRRNALQDGYRYTLAATYDHGFTPETSLRIVVRGALLDAEIRPESLRQGGADAIFAHVFGFATLFAQAGYTRTEARAPLALFGVKREDDRIDLGAGVIVRGLAFSGFAPLVRTVFTNSHSSLALYDYRRTRVEFGLTREF